ncbi:hypothetical protein SEVIR_1G309300v4 [Setaria viridis]|uniref:Dof zinc finger protein n=1 Tax=Setaria viridis TaxID=4556 RepID=A0A4U6WQW2_SETVI|nr:dof zinc finger protein 4-like [Setaria viridis]TKW41357.1 hypothetical protein SEVIR_1G309300v2 [Setaria viridis]
MQEFQSIPGLAGRLFGGAAAADLRRAQAQQGPGARCGGVSPAAAAPEAVKCPRCESTNTKFCYYNNYNLSQPRHFCKSCRRYWTKGGVLRNVPVGGGCRKAKRSSSSSSPSSAPSTPTSATDAKNPRRASASSPRSNSGSGSGSASPTAAVATAPTTPATPSSNSIGLTSHHTNPFSTVDVAPPAPIFADHAAALASLFAPPPPPPLPAFTFTAQPKEESAAAASAQHLAGQAVPSEAPSSASTDMTPFASLDTSGMFDLGDASAAAYWNAGSCWTDVHDPSMYLP